MHFKIRTAIDDGLCADQDRLWRLFREIAEGLSHIHQQGIIHRDLKPVNIFLDSRDQAKIGDFGLATTSFLALQCQDQQAGLMLAEVGADDESAKKSTAGSTDVGSSLTGQVGTALYVAPELMEMASRSTYNTKVRMGKLAYDRVLHMCLCFRSISTRWESYSLRCATSHSQPPWNVRM